MVGAAAVDGLGDVVEVPAWVDFVGACAFADGVVGGAPVSGVFGADEEVVFSADDDGAYGAFGGVVVDGEVAACGVAGEVVPVVEAVGAGIGHVFVAGVVSAYGGHALTECVESW